MRLVSWLQPSWVADKVRFLWHCVRRRHTLARFLGREEFLLHCLEHQPDIARFFREQHEGRSLLFGMGDGSVWQSELPFVQELVEKANALPGPIIEVGTLFGFTTTRMAVWKAPEKRIVTVDNYCGNFWHLTPASHRALTRCILSYLVETGQVEIVDADKNDFYAGYRGDPPALVFLDADHTYEETRRDIRWARQVGARIIAGHDYVFEGVYRAVNEAGGPARLHETVWALPSPDLERTPRRPAAHCRAA
jgi:hypothetical protein